MTTQPWDIVLVGGGLANALIAWRLATLRPELRWCLLERGDAIGGTASPRTWSFHHSDLGLGEAWTRQLETCAWPGYSVRFPSYERRLSGGYSSISSRDLHTKLMQRISGNVRFGVDVAAVGPTSVCLTTGERITAACVVDGRGLRRPLPYPCGYQKFLGCSVRLAEPHGLTEPVLMDATVDQRDGYRFVYVLPWTEDRALIEDTYYSVDSKLNEGVLADRIADYAKQKGWSIASEDARECGVLPIPLASNAMPVMTDGVVASGVQSGRFNPTTGYSVAIAARFATQLAEEVTFSPALADKLNAQSRDAWQEGDFFRRLNNMMFLAAEPDARWRVMAQFYQRDVGLIQRFYRGDLGARDRLQILSGKPPVPLAAGLKAFFARQATNASTAEGSPSWR